MKKSVCAFVVNDEGEILGVSRRGNPDDMGLPGGKVEPGESLPEACVRELKEETGIDANASFLILSAPCEGEELYECYTFLVEYDKNQIPRSCEEGIDVRWVTWNELLDEKCSFFEYNNLLHKAVNNMYAPEMKECTWQQKDK